MEEMKQEIHDLINATMTSLFLCTTLDSGNEEYMADESKQAEVLQLIFGPLLPRVMEIVIPAAFLGEEMEKP